MTAYEMRISDWSSDVCSSDLAGLANNAVAGVTLRATAREGGGIGTQGAAITETTGANTAGKDTVFADITAGDPGAARTEERRVGEEGVGTWGTRGEAVN